MNTFAGAAAAASSASHPILDLLIIGGGLSGVFVAHDHHHRSSSREDDENTSTNSPSSRWKLLEARSVLGGRLVNDDHGHRIDLGGAWVWPHHQPNLKHLLPQLVGVQTFPQPDQEESTRIDGGAVAIVEALAQTLPRKNLILNSPVTKCTWVQSQSECNGNSGDADEFYIQVETKTSNKNSTTTTDSIFRAKRVVIAVPPRLIAKHIEFDPPLSKAKQYAMESSHTWMAGVTKVAVIYPTTFWKETMNHHKQHTIGMLPTSTPLPSNMGPAFQVYDASTRDGSVAALTFFALVTTETEHNNDDQALAKQVTQQLAYAWKNFLNVDDDEAATLVQLLHSYTDVHVQRWPLEEYISEDPTPTHIHPHPYPKRDLSESEWDNHLLFAGSESDLESPGVMEGAIGAALRVLRDIP